jgi:protein O-mannosyl-transferase
VLTLAIYWPVTKYGFVTYDDPLYVTENYNVLHGVSWKGIAWAFTNMQYFYHPITWISLMLDVSLSHGKAGWFHLTNLWLHTANALLTFRLFDRMTGQKWRAAFVAALFAWHPLNVEPVVWVSERKGLLSMLFFLLTFLSYLGYVKSLRIRHYLPVLLWFSLSLLCKPQSIVTPLLFLLIDAWPLRRIGARAENNLGIGRILVEKLPMLLLVPLFASLTILAERNAGALSGPGNGIFERIVAVPSLWTEYLIKYLFPLKLAVFYPASFGSTDATIIVMSFVVMLLAALLLFQEHHTHPYLLFGCAWFITAISPVSGVFRVGSHWMADRYMYIPGIGLSVMVVWSLCNFLKWLHASVHTRVLCCSALLLCFVLLSKAQLSHWKTSSALFLHTLALTGPHVVSYSNLGIALMQEGKLDAALAQHSAALRLRPNMWEAYINRGNVYRCKGQNAEAINDYQRALELNSNACLAHYNLALALLDCGRLGDAAFSFARAMAINSDFTNSVSTRPHFSTYPLVQ